jgi:hypothetical protein
MCHQCHHVLPSCEQQPYRETSSGRPPQGFDLEDEVPTLTAGRVPSTKHGYVLTPGRHVGAEAQEDDGEPFEGEMTRLVATLGAQQVEATRLDAAIACARFYRRPYLRDRPWK